MHFTATLVALALALAAGSGHGALAAPAASTPHTVQFDGRGFVNKGLVGFVSSGVYCCHALAAAEIEFLVWLTHVSHATHTGPHRWQRRRQLWRNNWRYRSELERETTRRPRRVFVIWLNIALSPVLCLAGSLPSLSKLSFLFQMGRTAERFA